MASLTDLVTALGGKWNGSSGVALCPAHDDQHPSLSIAIGDKDQLLLFCHAGCSFRLIVDALEKLGLWPVDIDHRESPPRANPVFRLHRLAKLDAKCLSINKTRAQRYLQNRGINITLNDTAYCPRLWHPWSASSWPAMVNAVRTVSGHVASLHCTYLSYTEPPEKALIEPVRTFVGPLSGHAVHLAQAGRELLLGEGIETVASAMQLLRLPGWAALTQGNLSRHISLPDFVKEVTILADNDRVGLSAAINAAKRFRKEDRNVRIITPEQHNDFNDLLQGNSR